MEPCTERTRMVCRRRVVATLAAAPVLAQTLAACGGSATGSQTAPALAKPAKIEVLMEWVPGSFNRDAIETIIRRAQQQMPNLSVELTQAPGSGVRSYEMVLTRLAAGNPPDVSETYVAQSGNLSAKRI